MKLTFHKTKPAANKEQAVPAGKASQEASGAAKGGPSPVPATAAPEPIPVPKPKAKTKPANGVMNGNELGPPPLTLKQIAAHLGVCTKTVRRIIKKKGIPYGMVGGQIRVPAEHLPLFIDKQW